MGWDEYVANLLDGPCDRAAILGLDGNVWASSQGFRLMTQEINALVNGFEHPGALMSGGLHLAGDYYIFVRGDTQTLFGAKGTGGVCAYKCAKCIIVATFEKPHVMGECSLAVCRVGDYLASAGF